MILKLRQIGMWPLLAYILVMGILLSLGFWQLARSEQKREYLQTQEQLLQQDALVIDGNTPDDLASLKFRPVSVTGEYDVEHQFLVDNQHMHGKVGYLVLTPLKLSNQKIVLINRGWVPLNVDRKILPDIAFTQKQVSLTGRVNSFPSVGLQLSGAELPTSGWPAVVQVVQPKILGPLLHADVLSFQIELDPYAENGYLRSWSLPVLITPEKHIAYAVQWFGLAFTLTVLAFWSIRKKLHESATN